MKIKEILKKIKDADTVLVNLDERLGDTYLIRDDDEDIVNIFRECGWDELTVYDSDIHHEVPAGKMTDEEIIDKFSEYNVISLEKYLEDFDDEEEINFVNDNDPNFFNVELA